MSKIRPLHDRLFVRRIEEDQKGMIVIPDNAKEKPQQGEVVAVGDGLMLDSGQKIPLEVKVGDRIVFGKYSGASVKHEGEELLILHEEEVLAVLGD